MSERKLSVDIVRNWLSGGSPLPAGAGDDRAQGDPPCTPDEFVVFFLNYIRDAVEMLVVAAEQHRRESVVVQALSPAAPASNAASLAAQVRGVSGGAEADRPIVRAAAAALGPSEEQWPTAADAAGNVSRERQVAVGRSSPVPVAQPQAPTGAWARGKAATRLAPTPMPAPGAAAPSPGGCWSFSNGRAGGGGGIALSLSAAGSSSGGSSHPATVTAAGGGPRRKIAPTRVQALEVDQRFVMADLEQQPQHPRHGGAAGSEAAAGTGGGGGGGQSAWPPVGDGATPATAAAAGAVAPAARAADVLASRLQGMQVCNLKTQQQQLLAQPCTPPALSHKQQQQQPGGVVSPASTSTVWHTPPTSMTSSSLLPQSSPVSAGVAGGVSSASAADSTPTSRRQQTPPAPAAAHADGRKDSSPASGAGAAAAALAASGSQQQQQAVAAPPRLQLGGSSSSCAPVDGTASGPARRRCTCSAKAVVAGPSAPPAASVAAAAAADSPLLLLPERVRPLAELHAAVLQLPGAIPLAPELELLLYLFTLPAGVQVSGPGRAEQDSFSNPRHSPNRQPTATAAGGGAATQAGEVALPPHPALCCTLAGSRYAAAVLRRAGRLVHALPPPLQAAMASNAVLAAACPALAQDCRRAAERGRKVLNGGHGMRDASGFDASQPPGVNNDGNMQRSQEEQRRVSNHESVRDQWIALMREAAGGTQQLSTTVLGHSGQLGKGGGGGADGAFANANARGSGAATPGVMSPASALGDGGDGGDAGQVAAVLRLLQRRGRELLGTLRRDNYGRFAQLFTATVVQAASTGEALLDEELSSLAQRDVSKFQRLSQRLSAPPVPGSSDHPLGGGIGGGGQGGGAGGLGAGHQHRNGPRALGGGAGPGPRRAQFSPTAKLSPRDSMFAHVLPPGSSPSSYGGSSATATSPAGPWGSAASQKHHQLPGARSGGRGRPPGVPPQQYTQQQQPPTSSSPSAAADALEEAARSSLAAVSEFPRPLQPYVLFLEAVDSYRLNTHIASCMASQLNELSQPPRGGHQPPPGVLSQRATHATALAMLLSYLAFHVADAGACTADVHASDNAGGSSVGGGDDDVLAQYTWPPFTGGHPVDVLRALRDAAQGGAAAALVLPWVPRYLHFLGRSQAHAQTPYFRCCLRLLSQLHRSAALAPAPSPSTDAGTSAGATTSSADASSNGETGKAAGAAPVPLPRSPAPPFCTAHLVARCLLDDFREGAGRQLMAAAEAEAAAYPASSPVTTCSSTSTATPASAPSPRRPGGGGDGGGDGDAPSSSGLKSNGISQPQALRAAATWASRVAAALGTLRGQGSSGVAASCSLDPVYVHLCSPGLDTCQAMMQQAAAVSAAAGGPFGPSSSASGSGGNARPRAVRKITPSGSGAVGAAGGGVLMGGGVSGFHQRLPPDVAALLAPEPGEVVLQLRRSFVAQYSTAECKVKLADLLAYAADVISSNAADVAQASVLPQVVDGAALRLRQAALRVQGSPAGALLGREQLRAQVEAGLATILPQISQQALSMAAGVVDEYCRQSAVRALLGLTPPEYGDAVVGTAAAIVAEAAAAVAMQALVGVLPQAIRSHLSRQLDTEVRKVFKEASDEARRQAAAEASQAEVAVAEEAALDGGGESCGRGMEPDAGTDGRQPGACRRGAAAAADANAADAAGGPSAGTQGLFHVDNALKAMH